MEIDAVEIEEPQPQWVEPPSGAANVAISLLLALCFHQYLSVHVTEKRATEAFVALAASIPAIVLALRFHWFRCLGLFAPASALILIVQLVAYLTSWQTWHFGFFGFGVGLVVGGRLKHFASGTRFNHAGSQARSPLYDNALAALALGFVGYLVATQIPTRFRRFERYSLIEYSWSIAFGFSIFLLLYSWLRLFRPFFELCVEALMNRGYRIRAAGPGSTRVPIHGPVIVIANHACWWDPLFLAGVLPRPITPMMTSVYYDKWFLKPLMKYVFQTIRVPDARIRRETPEIQDAIQALDEGKCLVLFPEGYLRRKEELPLRRFGRGIWEILKERPETPVVACWIEGAWGSYSSYWNGPPTQNKIKEWRRPILVGMSEPKAVPPEVLANHMTTRTYLMNAVNAARKHAGVTELSAFTVPTSDEPTNE
jgi:1-acyl-sn-glycerol-3-phosphate acyltransferase